MKKKKALILGAGGFIGGHLINRLNSEGYYTRGVDLKVNPWGNNNADDFRIGDLRDREVVVSALSDMDFDVVFQLAAEMGGVGYISVGDNDVDVMHNSCMINLNLLEVSSKLKNKPMLVYSSSACVYNEHNQVDPQNPICVEGSEYPAYPDTEYGWEKLFSERLYQTYSRVYGMDCKIARFHNIYGENGSWNDGREKAPAALCRKVAMANDGDEIEIWGDGIQTRSFLHVSECLEGLIRFINSDFDGPVNLGSDRMVSINEFVDVIAKVANKKINKKHIEGPEGVRGRNSHNELIYDKLNWKPDVDLEKGIKSTYDWIKLQIENA